MLVDLQATLIKHLPLFFASAAELSGVPPYPDVERAAQLIREGRSVGTIYPEGALVPLFPCEEGIASLQDAWDLVGVSPRSPDTLLWDTLLLHEISKRHDLLRERGGLAWARDVVPGSRAVPLLAGHGATPNAVRDSLRRLSRGFDAYGPWIAPLRGVVPVVSPDLFRPAGRGSRA